MVEAASTVSVMQHAEIANIKFVQIGWYCKMYCICGFGVGDKMLLIQQEVPSHFLGCFIKTTTS